MKAHLGMVLPDLSGGGTERAFLTLARSLIERKYRVDIVLLNLRGEYRNDIPKEVRLYYRRRRKTDQDLLEFCSKRVAEVRTLSASPLAAALARRKIYQKFPDVRFKRSEARTAARIANYLREVHPQLLLSALSPCNNAAILAAALTNNRIPVVASLRNNVSMSIAYKDRGMSLAQALMPEADAVVGVSKGVAENAIETLDLDFRRVRAIYNPKPLVEIRELAKVAVAHPWFGSGEPPVILTTLRETPQKDWGTLVRAFGQVRGKVDARLAILGRAFSPNFEARIGALASSLGVEQDVAYLGFDENPYRYMARSNLFVLSSRWEGLPNVLIEALACGTPVVSTDAPYGPAEILENGRWGRLTTVGDVPAMAQAILDSLAGDTVPADALRHRAGDFSVESAVTAYEALFETLIGQNRAFVASNTGACP